MLLGFLNTGIPSDIMVSDSNNSFAIFKFSFFKNSIILSIIFINAFSFLGFPLTSTVLVADGYILSASLFYTFLNGTNTQKILYFIKNLPHISLNILAIILVSEAVFDTTYQLFLAFFKSNSRLYLNNKLKKMLVRYLIGLAIMFLSAIYEGYVL